MKNSVREAAAVFAAVLIIAAGAVMVNIIGPDSNAAHSYHSARSVYGSGNYVYDTVTFTGSGMQQTRTVSVGEIEQAALNTSAGYEGKYSLMTSGGVFSRHMFTGVKLYDYLQALGLKNGLSDSTEVRVVASDGYTIELSLGEIKKDDYDYYSKKGAEKAVKEDVPVLLAFGSDGVPLVGPEGNQPEAHKMTPKEGYDKTADNIGGPVRLVIGQKYSADYNAPDNAKWVSEVIVGDDSGSTAHSGSAASDEVLRVTIHGGGQDDAKTETKYFTFSAIEKFAASSAEHAAGGYYEDGNWYSGADLQSFIKTEAGAGALTGKVKFSLGGGTSLTVAADYISGAKDDADNYVTYKNGRIIKCVKPALGCARNGEALTKLYALIPDRRGTAVRAVVRECTSIDIYMGTGLFPGSNENASSEIRIGGSGMKKSSALTVAGIESSQDAAAETADGYAGADLLKLLEMSGIDVDADQVIIHGRSGDYGVSVDTLRSGEKYILATRKDGRALQSGGPVMLAGRTKLGEVTDITVTAKDGQWTHSSGTYRQYLGTVLKITGSDARAGTYTLKQLEAFGADDTVRDTFAASGGEYVFRGVILKKVIEDCLKDGVKRPSKITVTGADGFRRSIPVRAVFNGTESRYQPGQKRDVIIAYSVNGMPLVPDSSSAGYKNGNGYGPLRIVMENQISAWVKNVKEIRLGE